MVWKRNIRSQPSGLLLPAVVTKLYKIIDGTRRDPVKLFKDDRYNRYISYWERLKETGELRLRAEKAGKIFRNILMENPRKKLVSNFGTVSYINNRKVRQKP